MTDYRGTWDYFEGFWEALEGEPLFPDASPGYEQGWRSAHELKESFSP